MFPYCTRAFFVFIISHLEGKKLWDQGWFSVCLSISSRFLFFLFKGVHWCYLISFRLMPQCGNTLEGKKHVPRVPIKFLRPEASLRKKNLDRMNLKLFINDTFGMRKLFTPHVALFISNKIKPKSPWVLLQKPSRHPCWCILNIKWCFLIIIFWWAYTTIWFFQYMGSAIWASRVKSATRERLSFTDAAVNVKSHQPKHMLMTMHELFKSAKVVGKPVLLKETDGAQDEVP